MSKGSVMIAAAPSIGPAIVTIAGIDVPVAAMLMSMAALLLARMIAQPVPKRTFTKNRDRALTCLLVIVLFHIVTGQLFGTEPLGAGMAIVWAIGLGLSGMLVLEIFADRVLDAIAGFFGRRRGGDSG